MASTFRGLEAGRSGVAMAMLQLEIAGQNIANANTEGYTRQRVIGAAKPPPGSQYVISQIYNKMIGQGVEATGIEQLRSAYLDQQYRHLNDRCQYQEYRMQGMTYLTGVMNELDKDASITVSLDRFNAAVAKLAEDPSSEEFRLNLRQNAVALTDTVNFVYDEMLSLCASQNDSISAVAQDISSKARQLAELNTSIAGYERSGSTANELRDRRNLLLDQLSGLVNMEYTVNADDPAMIDVTIGGASLVSGSDFNAINCQLRDTPNPITGISSYALTLDGVSLETQYTAEAGQERITGGELFAHMQLVENSGAENAGIPYYVSQLDGLVSAIVETTNAVHQQGYTFPDGKTGLVSHTGVNFFETPTGPGTFSVSADVLESVWNIAASDEEVDPSGLSDHSGNAKNILALQEALDNGGLYSRLNTMTTHLAIAAQTSKGLLDTNDALRKSVNSQRSSMSSVSLDEEATNIIMYKQSYNASARIVSAIDEMLDKLINGTGRVGL